MTGSSLSVDPGLLVRLRAAGTTISWRPAERNPQTPKGHRARIAHLLEEEARVESWGTDSRGGVLVDSGPVGALVLLLEVDRRGAPVRLEPCEAGEEPAFPGGAVRALWGGTARPSSSKLSLSDLVELARYALR